MDGYAKATIAQAILFGLLIGLVVYKCNVVMGERENLKMVVYGQEATITAYKDNLTSCLKDSKVATQDEFTGE